MRVANAREVGLYIRERRGALAMTQAQLAERARVSRRWLSDVEGGKDTAELGRIIRTLRAVGVIVDLRLEKDDVPLDLDEHLARYREAGS